MKREEWKPVDYVVVILTATVSLILFIGIIVAAMRDEPLTESQSKTITHVITALISIVSMYVGAMIQKHRDKGE